MPEQQHPKATNGVPVIVARKTGYYITFGDSETYADPAGHRWFAKPVALAIARELPGGWFYEGSHSTIKQVVTGYLPPAETPQQSVTPCHAGNRACPICNPPPAPAPSIYVQRLLGCTCEGIGQTGAHARGCMWAGA
jgi:hypothetical protein